MITKIILENIPSYKKKTELNIEKKRINLIYGLNGSGKTQLSRYLADTKGEIFRDCSIERLTDERVLVYNQDFIEEHFYNTDEQKSIFTLSRENKEIEKKLKDMSEELEEYKEKLEKQKEEYNRINGDLQEKREDIEKEFWKIKERHYNSDTGDFFSGRIRSKKNFFEFISGEYKKYKEVTEISISLKEIEDKLKILNDDKQTPLEKIDILDHTTLSNIEKNGIWSEIIAGNKESSIAELIRNLNNESWVKQGFSYIKEDSNFCPFCQEKTIDKDFVNSLEEYFNTTYENKVEEIENLKQSYNAQKEKISPKEAYYRDKILTDKDFKFDSLYQTLRTAVEDNLKLIEDKLKEPNKAIKLIDTEDLCDSFNQYISEKQGEVDKLNHMLENKEKEKSKIAEEFWKAIIYENRQIIELHLKTIQEKKKEKEEQERKCKEIEDKITNKAKEITEEQKKTVNIQEAVDTVNSSLKDLGIVNFKIEINDEERQTYKIVREGENEKVFKTLSEGEKTIISFLYFLQLCQGKESADEIDTDKIIVIDDPISSLSFNYVFDVAQFIRFRFFGGKAQYKQIFILTHNLYFFNELLKYFPRLKDKQENIKLFRFSKDKDNQTYISEMDNEEILTDYQVYWLTLQEYKNGKNYNKAMIPNLMRNILEHFVEFIHKGKKYDKVIEKLKTENEGNIKYKSFIRYINRESHSDLSNLSDSKDIDTESFLEAFKEIFEKLGHIEHYDAMMGIKSESSS